MVIEKKVYMVEEIYVEDADYKAVMAKAQELKGYGKTPIQKGYKTAEEESKVFWFKATKKVEVKE